ncbi:hypothetical protein ACFX13_013470 [Malus domestica]
MMQQPSGGLVPQQIPSDPQQQYQQQLPQQWMMSSPRSSDSRFSRSAGDPVCACDADEWRLGDDWRTGAEAYLVNSEGMLPLPITADMSTRSANG